MSKKIKILSLCVATALVMTSILGCAPKEEAPVSSTTPESKTESTVSKEEKPAERVKLSWLIASDQSAYKDDNIVETELEKRFNVDLTTIKINAFDNEKLNVTLASGTIPDVLIKWGVNKFYDDGVIRSITEEMMKENMPNTYKAMGEIIGPNALNKFINVKDNKLMAVPQIVITGNARLCEVIRQDWLDTLKLPVPKTLEEFENVLRKFTFDDPDGNGKNDTYGMGGAGMHPDPLSWQFLYTFGAYGINPSFYQEHDGKIQHDVTTVQYKEALKTLAKWYSEGLIDREFVTTQDADYSNKFVNGKFGVWRAHPTYLDPNAATGNVKLMKANNPKANPVMFAPFTGPEGKSGTTSYGPNGSWGMMFGIKATDEQVAMGMQIAEAINSDVDLFTLTFSGVEGETFTHENGIATPKKGLVQAEYGVGTYRTGSYISWDVAKVFTPEIISGYIQETEKYPLMKQAISTGQLADVLGDKADTAEVDKVVKEFYFNAITGKINVDKEWDKYLDTYNKLGGAAMFETAQTLTRTDK